MNIAKKAVLSLALVAAAAVAPITSQAQQLTGITVFTTDLNGNISGDAFFNTFGDATDTVSNIYVINDPVAQTFYNSGNSGGAGAPTGIDLSLALGAQQFFASVDPFGVTQGMFYGINLFFNGNNTTPGISAYTSINTPAGTANMGIGLANTGGVTTTPGANSLSFVDPITGNTVILSLFNYASTRVSGLPSDFPEDLVGQFSLGANGTPDNYVDFTLTVVPEPTTWALLGVGLGAMFWLTRSRRRQA